MLQVLPGVWLTIALLTSLSAGLNTSKVQQFAVDGANFPGIGFDIGPSYAGTIPIASANSSRAGNDTEGSLFFWYFPSNNTNATNETLVWFNGGPGCSSLGALLQENGPVSWQPGFAAPSPNPFGWQLLTNTIWVEFPVGVGFSQGTTLAADENDAAEQFLGFWKNFVDIFDLHHNDVYLSGESYAGMYVPYVASHMLDRNDLAYFNLQGTLLYDASLASNAVMKQLVAVDFITRLPQLFGFDDNEVKRYQTMADSCNFTRYIEDTLQYPPSNKPSPPPDVPRTCELWTQSFREASSTNPCFNVYDVRSRCPYLPAPISTPDGAQVPTGQADFFNRDDVKAALHAPVSVQWMPCVDSSQVFVNGVDLSAAANKYGPTTVLPSVIERSKRTMIAHGDLDFDLIKTGTLLVIQNMTWGGQQGFGAAPTDTFVVPFGNTDARQYTGGGPMGVTKTERGLTFCSVKLSGHMVPQYQGGAAFRHVEVLLGRVPSLNSSAGFTA